MRTLLGATQRNLVTLLCLFVVSFAGVPFAFSQHVEHEHNQAMAAGDTAAQAIAPEGFTVDVIAAEPLIAQPIALAWDHKGRLWIAECRTYADRSKNYDLTESDRIVILEDRDADGTYETRTVFADNLHRLTGLSVGFGGVWALTSPTMVFIPDRDDNLVADGPAEVMLDGFDLKYTRHTIANGLKWGPDGWLYGRQGIVAVSDIGPPGTPASERLSIDTGVWRYHPQSHRVEAWTRGGTNPWGHDWNAEGDLFYINTVIGHFWHAIPGAYTKRMFGQYQRPYLYRLIDMHADHWHFDTGGSWMDTRENVNAADAFGGGHAHTGLLVYQADKWPEEYRNDVYTLNFHGRRINRESLHHEGSGFVAKHEADLIKFPDEWFRGIDLAQGPDGDVYVLDWSDTGECHDHDGINRESGRVYRVRYGEVASGPVTPPVSAAEVDAWLRHPNVWYARRARLLIQEKFVAGGLPDDWLSLMQDRLRNEPNDLQSLRYAQVLHSISSLDVVEMLEHKSELLRIQGLRMVRDNLGTDHVADIVNSRQFIALQELAKKGSARERLAVASLLPQLNPVQQLPIAVNLLSHGEDAGDHNYPLMVWFGIEPLVARADQDSLMRLMYACRIPELRRFVIRRLGEDYDRNRSLLSKLILAQPQYVADHLLGLADALAGIPRARALEDWVTISAFAKGESVVDQLGAVFGDGRSYESLFAIADDIKADPGARRRAVGYLGASDYPNLKDHLLRWIADDQLSGVSAQVLARYPDDVVGKVILQRMAFMKPAERIAAVDVLVSRVSWCNLLLRSIATNRLGVDILTTVHARRIAQLNDPELTQLLRSVWGEVNDFTDDPGAAALAQRLRHLITPPRLQTADPSAGRAHFVQSCASCHQLYGEGGSIGPDLTGSGRNDLAYLVDNVLYPSAVVPAGYQITVVKLNDGRTLSGVVTASGEKRLTLNMVGSDELMHISVSDIKSLKKLDQSLMPAGLLNDMADQELCDLFSYLMGDHQVPLKDDSK